MCCCRCSKSESIKIGIIKIKLTIFRSPSMYAVRVGSNYSNAYGEIVPVSSYTIHPKYSQVYNDICVAELSKPLEFSKAVQPIALPEEGNELPEGTLTVVTGFGETEPKEYRGRRLQAVRVPIVSPEKCKAAYPIVDETMLCAGYEEGGKDACQVDHAVVRLLL